MPLESIPGELFYSSAFLIGIALSKEFKKESHSLRDESGSLISLYESKRWFDNCYFNTILCAWLSSLTDFKITFENEIVENLINLNILSENYNNLHFNLFITKLIANDLKNGKLAVFKIIR